ncbi:MAG TPA: hypothetical protein VFG35_08045 [Actinoplanes sp.]|nr:hypothetical protein [Actinoplanes sp.]
MSVTPPPFDLSLPHPLSGITTVKHTPATGHVEITRTDGVTFRGDIGVTDAYDSIRESLFDLRTSTLQVALQSGVVLTMEIGTMRASADRPVIYLDQNHWIDVARYCIDSPGLSDDRKRVCRRITELAAARKIIVPVSAAHLTEIAKKAGRQRRDVAQVMVATSRGWQMTSPLRVRAHELRQIFGSEPEGLGKSEVFSLDPHALWSDHAQQHRAVRPDAALPAEIQRLIARMSWAEAMVEIFVDRERSVSDMGQELADKWAISFQELAVHVRGNPKARLYLRDVTKVRVLTDIQHEMVLAAHSSGLTPLEFQKWWSTRADEDIASMPMLGRIRELVHVRVSNADDKWHRNDLNDTLFLCTAAGYADIVVGEKKMTTYLGRVHRSVRPGAQLFRRLEDALAAIEAAAT